MPATAPSSEGPLAGYGIEDITWELETESGATVNLTGTIEQVLQYAELNQIPLKQNPDYNVSDASSSSSTSIHARAGETLDCNVAQLNLARVDKINDGVTYLRQVAGKPANGPGPNNCGRVSCSWNSAIYWCNDVRIHTYPWYPQLDIVSNAPALP